MKTYLAEPCGYCQGVQRALMLAISFKKNNPTLKCYSLGEIVHNEKVVSELNNLGIECLNNAESDEDKIKKITKGSLLIFGAHGHDKNLENLALKRGIKFLDTTCPMVEQCKSKILNAISVGYKTIFIGKKDHPETNSILSLGDSIHLYDNIKDNLKSFKNEKIYVTTQTTYSLSEVENIFENIKKQLNNVVLENGVCFETKVRQESVYKLPREVDCVFIVGGMNSSNTRRLFEIAKSYFSTLKIFHIRNELEIDKKILSGCSSAAIIAGASTNKIDVIKIKHKLEDIW